MVEENPGDGEGEVVATGKDISACIVETPKFGILDIGWRDYKEMVALNPSTIADGVPPSGSMLKLHHNWHYKRPDTAFFRWGRAVHCALFEPGLFDQRYTFWQGRRAGGAYREFVSEAWEDGKEVLAEKEAKSAIEAGKRFISDPLVQRLTAAGKAEQTLLAGEWNVQCRGRVDWISTSQHVLVDLKTTKDVSARAFGRDFFKYHYDVKLGLYQRWLQANTQEQWPVEVICIESQSPFDITVVPIPDSVLAQGAGKGMAVVRRFSECVRTGVWPGVANGKPYILDVPVWEMDDDELTGAEEA
jgi:hypothetical protein